MTKARIKPEKKKKSRQGSRIDELLAFDIGTINGGKIGARGQQRQSTSYSYLSGK